MKRLRVLVVDDDQSIRKLLKIAFSVEEGVMEVREASTGLEALEVCKEFKPDLVFMDYWMPTMNGKIAAQGLRRMIPSAHIVAFSGVLEDKPEWADDLFVKGDIPDLELVIDLAQEQMV